MIFSDATQFCINHGMCRVCICFMDENRNENKMVLRGRVYKACIFRGQINYDMYIGMYMVNFGQKNGHWK